MLPSIGRIIRPFTEIFSRCGHKKPSSIDRCFATDTWPKNFQGFVMSMNHLFYLALRHKIDLDEDKPIHTLVLSSGSPLLQIGGLKGWSTHKLREKGES